MIEIFLILQNQNHDDNNNDDVIQKSYKLYDTSLSKINSYLVTKLNYKKTIMQHDLF